MEHVDAYVELYEDGHVDKQEDDDVSRLPLSATASDSTAVTHPSTPCTL